ncbi:MAG TPA: cytochrome c oxidase subunit II [Rhizomicrobium sp.]|nr:cytochrome c oxidase subunit II [Rhizomicrobium sp.]
MVRRSAFAIAAALYPARALADAPLNYLTAHSVKEAPVLTLTWGLIAISLAVIVIVGVLLSFAVLPRRGRGPSPPGETIPLAPAGAASGLGWIWIGAGVSSLVLLASAIWTMAVLAQVNAPPRDPPLTIEVTAHQWWWEVRYLSKDPSKVFVTANEIHIPTGAPVKIRLVAADVIHSFWAPQLSGKTDLIPGQTNIQWFDAKDPGVYRGQCAEYCGLQHAKMSLLVIADRPADFEAWRAHQLQPAKPPASDAARAGLNDFVVHCGSCHGVRGADAAGVFGPDLSHLMTRRTIAAGSYPNTIGYLSGWIADPQSLKPGSMMPRLGLTGPQLARIRAYLQTLK